MKKLFVLGSVTGCLLVALNICLPLTSAFGQVKIGIFGPLTGPVADTGYAMLYGVEMAADEINSAGGIKGVGKIEISSVDSQCMPAKAVDAVNKLIYRDKVTAAVGDVCSGATLAAMKITAQEKVPLLNNTSTAAAITEQGNQWVFRLQAKDGKSAKKLVEFAVGKLGLKRLAIMHDSSAYGSDGAVAVEKALKDRGLEAVGRFSFQRGDKDFSAQLMKVKEAGADGVVFWSIYFDTARALKQAQQLGVKFQGLGSDAMGYPKFIELAGDAAEGFIASAIFDVNDPRGQVQDFMAKFRSKYKKEPDPTSSCAYDTMYILANGIQKAGSLDRTKIRDALRETSYEGVAGKVSFDETGDSIREIFHVQIKGRKFVRVD